jgi:capsular polysaccharide biosynthesis protein
VELFSKADIIVGPHGAGLVWMLFAEKIRVLELHATQTPRNHYHTLARGLGQEYHFLLHEGGEDDDFTVNMQELEHVLRHKLGLQPLSHFSKATPDDLK